jgi:hypothetical protein
MDKLDCVRLYVRLARAGGLARAAALEVTAPRFTNKIDGLPQSRGDQTILRRQDAWQFEVGAMRRMTVIVKNLTTQPVQAFAVRVAGMGLE